MAVFGSVMPTSTALALTPFPSFAGSASALLGGIGATVAALSGVFVSALDLSPSLAMATVMAVFATLSAAILVLAAPRSGPEQPAALETVAETAPLAEPGSPTPLRASERPS